MKVVLLISIFILSVFGQLSLTDEIASMCEITDETEFNKYKGETNISIKIPGFKIKNVYFKGNTIVNS